MDYNYYKEIVKGEQLPCAIVDLDLLDQNIQSIFKRSKKTLIRIASKSVRVPFVLDYIIKKDPEKFSGLMCYSVEEADWLAEKGFKNLLVAYPYIRIDQKIQNIEQITFMVDKLEHLEALQGLPYDQIKICIDLDLSVDFKLIYFGVYRSSLKSLDDVKKLVDKLKNYPKLKLSSVMGYEAQIAGVGDKNPFKWYLNYPIRLLKKLSLKKLRQKRAQVVEYIKFQGYELEFVNGGGTGSIETTIQESCVTEVAVGSGFFNPLLFDYYKDFSHKPACFYAVEVTRTSKDGVYTCASGGYPASGSAGEDRLPRPFLPKGCALDVNEGAGEVQTPVYYDGDLKLGDPLFFRHAKAGELCERFNEVLLIKEGRIVDKVKTYRGEGKCFL